jgi:hypothetical protein
MKNESSLHYEIPMAIVKRDGPFEEFKQDGAFVSVELVDGRHFAGILVIYPNQIAAMEAHDVLPFDPSEIVRAYQTVDDLRRRSSSSWKFWI